ncbi:catecholate siderophore receptor [Verrucomicrobium sp. GAS474]|uniref:TonB-dependent receptor n=1 Tax=Verrucomicrobium sp. GAS474 TaxID=1882831 RepID=UPI000879FF21|nr:TonB-dependent siderophore receptor [Verrucomicrobium sp. GAS474]SDT92470.1 catecholate siderophore receptor [Verrucomicrobium sp. GAS474]
MKRSHPEQLVPGVRPLARGVSSPIRYGRISMMALVNAIMIAGAAGAKAETPSASSSASTSAPGNTADTGTATKTKKEDAALDEVVVTAKTKSDYQTDKLSSGKYTEPLRDVPQTVTIVPKEVMQDQNASSLRQVLQNVPGVTMQAGEGGNLSGDNINIRGFNARNDIFVDGMRDSGVYNRDPFNLEQVEVIKGPGSTVSGHGSTGGSLNMVTKTPEQENYYSANVGLGTDEYTRETMDINQQMKTPAFAENISDIAFRLNGVYQYNQFANLNTVYNNHWAIAPSATFKIGPDTKLTFSYLHQQESNLTGYGIPTVSNGYSFAANPTYHSYFGQPAPYRYSSFFGYSNNDHENTWTDIPTFKIEHTFDDDLKMSNTSRYDRTYRDSVVSSPRFENVGNGITPTATTPLTAGQVARESKGRHQLDDLIANATEITQRFKTWDLDHTFVGTVEFSREQENNRTANGVPESTLSGDNYPYILNYGDETLARAYTSAFSLFDTIKFDEHWETSLGMRFDHIQSDSQTLGYITPTGAGHFYRTDDLPSWRAALVYKPVKSGSFYAGYGTSFNSSIQGTANGNSAAGLTSGTSLLEPEADETYEIGTKWDVLKDKLSLTTSLFRTNKTNARITDPTTSIAYSLSGMQRVQGVEVGATGSITEEWKVFAGYTYMESKVISANYANLQSIGKRLPNTPDQSASVWTTYDLPKGFTIGSGAQFMDRRFENTNNINSEPGYWKQDAMLSYKLNQNITMQLNVTNLWDVEYIDRIGGSQSVPGAGRSVVFSTNFKY